MAVSIDWATRVITVPRADMTLLQASPEIRGLDVDAFRLELKALEDNEDGITFPDTHEHNTEKLLGGVYYARIVEIINGYTVTFEDGQYAVKLSGANNNIEDVMNVNQVSLRSSNSAGLIRAKIAPDVWDAPYTDHQNADTMGQLLLRSWLTKFGIEL